MNRILTRFIDRLIEWIRAENLIKIYSINANPYWIRQALCSPSVSPINNYEVLEVLGDSILKYITSIYLYF
jgi:dsRNA-specific ribonuclease